MPRTQTDARVSTAGHRAAIHAALADPTRLTIIDELTTGDVSPSELAASLEMPSNLLAHHLKVLEQTGLLMRTRSEGDGRRTYLTLVPGSLEALTFGTSREARRVVFVCTANSARSILAESLWRLVSAVPAASAGTHPAAAVESKTFAVAKRHKVPVRRRRPQAFDDTTLDGDLVVTVCDNAHEALDPATALHWSVPDPVRIGTDAAFETAFDTLNRRVRDLAPRVTRSN